MRRVVWATPTQRTASPDREAAGHNPGNVATAILSPGHSVVQRWLAEHYPAPTVISLPEAARVFGIPRTTLYRLAQGAPGNGAPIIRFHDRKFGINPQAFADWLCGPGAAWADPDRGPWRRPGGAAPRRDS
jgi:hypothetical protein